MRVYITHLFIIILSQYKYLNEKGQESFPVLSDRFLPERVHVPPSIVYGAREEVGERPKRERAQGEVVRGDGEAEPLDEFAEIVWT